MVEWQCLCVYNRESIREGGIEILRERKRMVDVVNVKASNTLYL